MTLELTKCHGSGNEFFLVDAIAENIHKVSLPALSRALCRDKERADGLLVLSRHKGDFAMRMFNPDGSEAEMCGNGIRCTARAALKYTAEKEFTIWSGGRAYAVRVEEPIFDSIPTFGVDIPLALSGGDFRGITPFVEERIPELDERLLFTFVSAGNPHIVARTPLATDTVYVEALGHRAEQCRGIFPNGVNLSLYDTTRRNRIFVATYERGAGITLSCGTAMTSSAAAAALIGVCDFDSPIDVCNRGGMVRCTVHCKPLVTRLTGNASYIYSASVQFDGERITDMEITHRYDDETKQYRAFSRGIVK